MSSGLFDVGLSGLQSSQKALRTAGHNIANVDTPGYTRQSVVLEARPPQGAGDGFIGTGVSVSTVTREIDTFLQAELRAGTASLSQAQAFYDLAAQVDNVLADSAGGLSPAMQSFFEGLHAVAADPSSVPARQVLLSDAQALVRTFQTTQSRLDDVGAEVEQGLRDAVGEVNTLAQEIADINQQLIREEGAFSGQPANDLRDQRDELVRQLAEKIDVTTFVQSNGALNVMVGNGQGLVTGGQAGSLGVGPGAYDPSKGELNITVGGVTSDLTGLIGGGEIGGLLRFRREVLGEAERGLGQLAVGLAQTLNEQHAAGQTLTGALGGNLFTPIDQSGPVVFAHRDNAGVPPADLAVSISDVRTLPTSDYLLERVGAAYRLTRLSDGTVFGLGTFPGAPEEVDGLRLSLAGGAIADGDSFLIEPTAGAVRQLAVVPTAPEAIAAAAPVRSSAALANLGDAVISAPRVNLLSDELVLTFDSPPATFDVVDATTGASLLSDVAYVPGAPITVNGVTTSISGAPAAGDVFRVTNTVSTADPGNGGTGTIALASTAGPDPNLVSPVTITFTSPTTFDVSGAITGSPVTGVAYTPGAPISFNGWTVTISGTPSTGDQFSVTANTGGVGDNRNALALAALQTTPTLEGERSTYNELYGQVVARVGTATRQGEIDLGARETLLDQLNTEREALSGVNLDEEAANLLRFQQSYQASAQLITVANQLFDSLLAAVSR